MSANDDYPYRLHSQKYQTMCDEIDDNRATISNLLATIEGMTDRIEELSEMDDLAGKEIEKLKLENIHFRELLDLYEKEKSEHSCVEEMDGLT